MRNWPQDCPFADQFYCLSEYWKNWVNKQVVFSTKETHFTPLILDYQLLQSATSVAEALHHLHLLLQKRATLSTEEQEFLTHCRTICSPDDLNALPLFPKQQTAVSTEPVLLISLLLPTAQQVQHRRIVAMALFCVIAAAVTMMTGVLSILAFTPGVNWRDPFHYFASVFRAIPAFWGIAKTPYEEFAMYVKEMEMDFTVSMPIPSVYGLSLGSLAAGFYAAYRFVSSREILDPALEAAGRRLALACGVFMTAALRVTLSKNTSLNRMTKENLEGVLEGVAQTLQSGSEARTAGAQNTQLKAAFDALAALERGLNTAGKDTRETFPVDQPYSVAFDKVRPMVKKSWCAWFTDCCSRSSNRDVTAKYSELSALV